MSVKTFIGWFFGWLSAFKIDFCKEIDPFCGHNPKMLACDGAEGPKDVFCSLLKYKEDMPQELFYDNACHLFSSNCFFVNY